MNVAQGTIDFSGWYWDAIFLVIYVGLLLGLAGLLTFVISALARLLGRTVTRGFVLRAFAIVVGIEILLIPVALLARDKWNEYRIYERPGKSLTFQTYMPTYTPEGLEATSVLAYAPPSDQLAVFVFESEGGSYLTMWESPLTQGDYCGIRVPEPHGNPALERRNCKTADIGGGRTIQVTRGDTEAVANTASLALDENGIVIEFYGLDREELYRFVRSLRPVPADEIEYFDHNLRP